MADFDEISQETWLSFMKGQVRYWQESPWKSANLAQYFKIVGSLWGPREVDHNNTRYIGRGLRFYRRIILVFSVSIKRLSNKNITYFIKAMLPYGNKSTLFRLTRPYLQGVKSSGSWGKALWRFCPSVLLAITNC